MEKEPVEETGAGPGPGADKVEKQDRMLSGQVGCTGNLYLECIQLHPTPNPCSLLHFWRHLIINLF